MRNWLCFVCLLSVAGCGTDPNDLPPEVYPVTGQVLVDGQPAAGVEVTLLPSDAPMVPRIPHAATGADGRFAIGTFKDGDGAAAGGYQIVMTWPPEKRAGTEEPAEEASEADRLFGWYSGTQSTLSFRVKPGPNEIPPIKVPNRLAPPPPSPGVPGRN